MKTFSLLIVLFFVYSIIAFAQDTSFAVSSNGNVGIGTTNPSAKLDVVGDIAVSGTVDGVDLSNFSRYFL